MLSCDKSLATMQFIDGNAAIGYEQAGEGHIFRLLQGDVYSGCIQRLLCFLRYYLPGIKAIRYDRTLSRYASSEKLLLQ